MACMYIIRIPQLACTVYVSHLEVAIVQVQPDDTALGVDNAKLASLTRAAHLFGGIPIGTGYEFPCSNRMSHGDAARMTRNPHCRPGGGCMA